MLRLLLTVVKFCLYFKDKQVSFVQYFSVGSYKNLHEELGIWVVSHTCCPSNLSELSIPSDWCSENTLGKVGPKEMKNRGKFPRSRICFVTYTVMGLLIYFYIYMILYILYICLVNSTSSFSLLQAMFLTVPVHMRPKHKHNGKDLGTEIRAPEERLCSLNHRTSQDSQWKKRAVILAFISCLLDIASGMAAVQSYLTW